MCALQSAEDIPGGENKREQRIVGYKSCSAPTDLEAVEVEPCLLPNLHACIAHPNVCLRTLVVKQFAVRAEFNDIIGLYCAWGASECVIHRLERLVSALHHLKGDPRLLALIMCHDYIFKAADTIKGNRC
jgi:hypothetical protein